VGGGGGRFGNQQEIRRGNQNKKSKPSHQDGILNCEGGKWRLFKGRKNEEKEPTWGNTGPNSRYGGGQSLGDKS